MLEQPDEWCGVRTRFAASRRWPLIASGDSGHTHISLRRLSLLLTLAEGAWALAVYEGGEIRRQMAANCSVWWRPCPFTRFRCLAVRPIHF